MAGAPVWQRCPVAELAFREFAASELGNIKFDRKNIFGGRAHLREAPVDFPPFNFRRPLYFTDLFTVGQ